MVVRSDVERKRQAGIALEERMPAGSYYAGRLGQDLCRLPGARRAGAAGRATASCSTRCSPARTSAPRPRRWPPKVGVPFEGIWLDVPKEVAQARVAARTGDASDATPAVVERQFGYDLGRITWQRRA